ncbi:MAG: hypothetical protein IJZ80_09035, partial [Clostridia bacterium]|nr:hypothetical protein [Clostridia bacterium]
SPFPLVSPMKFLSHYKQKSLIIPLSMLANQNGMLFRLRKAVFSIYPIKPYAFYKSVSIAQRASAS